MNCALCGSEESSTPEAWSGPVTGFEELVTVCSEACREQLWWIVSKGPSFGSAVAGPRSDVGTERRKVRK
jgi:hypothetical protein